ncbi:MAG: cytochrome D ubiquinol oxidase subunit I [Rhodobacteraceae bacterium]|nr:cytochrome D ubiquinol oxidase subunit I [Paracoccaceae bacterium]
MTRIETGGLDPEDWEAFRAEAHAMLDAAMDQMQSAGNGRVWTPLPEAQKAGLRAPLPREGAGVGAVRAGCEALLSYGVGNAHPRFFGWVHGSGTPGNMIAEIAAAAMNANLGGRDHGAIYVERQVVEWCREMMGFPEGASGLIVSGTSLATIIALKAARERALGVETRKEGIGAARLVGYCSSETHACVARAFDMLGIGSDALRLVPVDAEFRMQVDVLRAMIAEDRAAGLQPFALIGTAGSVNMGAIDPLETLAGIACDEGLWFHVDGAFGAMGMASARLRPLLRGLEAADSLAFDFHKWMHVNYDAGCVLIRDEADHRRAFAARPDYLEGATRGLAAGDRWAVDYGPELSRGFRALKVWASFVEHGVNRIGALAERNCDQAAYLGGLVEAEATTECLAPVTLNICCFRVLRDGLDDAALDALNAEIVLRLQEGGIAAPSTTRIKGRLAIRVNITNHRTTQEDIDILFRAVLAEAWA